MTTAQDKMRLLMSRANAPEDMWEPAVRIIDEALLAERRRAIEALEVRTWTEAERDGMAAAYQQACAKHGHYETLFAVGAWLLRHRAESLSPSSPRGDNR